MNIIGNRVNFLYNSLSITSGLEDITFVLAYENDIKPTPLEKPIVALSAKGCEIGEKLTKTNDNGEIVLTNERQAKITISIDFYLPYSQGGVAAHNLFDRVATQLIFVKNFDILKASCSETEYDSSCQAIVLKSTFVFCTVVEA